MVCCILINYIMIRLAICEMVQTVKEYVGFESWDQQQMGAETAHPGRVDTSSLFKGYYSDVMIVIINILL